MVRVFFIAIALLTGFGIFYFYGIPATATPGTGRQEASPRDDVLTGWGPYTFGMSPVEVRLIAPTNLKTDNRGKMSYEVMIDDVPFLVEFAFMNNRLAAIWLYHTDEIAIGESVIDEEAACKKRLEATYAKIIDRYSRSARMEMNGHYIKLHFPDTGLVWTYGGYSSVGIPECEIGVGYIWGEAKSVPSATF